MANPSLVRRIADEGHLIGNHSTYHARMTLLSDEGLRADVRLAGETIAERSGVINLGVEGSMLAGALAAAIGSAWAGPWYGLAAAALAGLALAETTPGPLIIVLQFMGFMAGWNQPAPLAPDLAAVLAALLAAWATFLPSFVFIFLGAPYVERITAEPRVAGALAAITAAVVGIIATLALLFARVVLLPNGIAAAPDWGAIGIAVAVWLLLTRTRVDLPWILAAAAGAGFLLH